MAQEITVGGGGGFKLAPDLNYISNKLSNAVNVIRISGIDPSVGFTTALSLNGKFLISYLDIGGLNASGTTDIRLTVDGVLIWDTSVTNTVSNLSLLGSQTAIQESFYCNTSLLLEIRKTDDTSVNLDYLARPVL